MKLSIKQKALLQAICIVICPIMVLYGVVHLVSHIPMYFLLPAIAMIVVISLIRLAYRIILLGHFPTTGPGYQPDKTETDLVQPPEKL